MGVLDGPDFLVDGFDALIDFGVTLPFVFAEVALGRVVQSLLLGNQRFSFGFQACSLDRAETVRRRLVSFLPHLYLTPAFDTHLAAPGSDSFR